MFPIPFELVWSIALNQQIHGYGILCLILLLIISENIMKIQWLFIPLLACAAELKVDLDEDGDGLLTSQEEDLGTDPTVADSDGDGHNDGDEVAGGFDPLDEDDRPYLGGYEINRCDEDVVSTGFQVGQIAESFELMDQFGEILRLSDFCGQTILLEGSAFW